MAREWRSCGDAGLITEFNALRAEVVELRTQLIAVLAKLDADGGVTDVNFESTLTPAAITSQDLTR